jgi:hypothetical protein
VSAACHGGSAAAGDAAQSSAAKASRIEPPRRT